ncbi:SIS domain-containing protein [Succinatimonas hippei]|uniref:D-sedoheptulose-7-phosphate isomerase n=1 Tax=Succinatimonas hippei TaxID=626938 RepID=UPI0025A34B55|nr:SIS domain-containing protein [Succinatimonas hippei]MDM8119735.1 SIS domain-containing protein [Succinatimonas hippei]
MFILDEYISKSIKTKNLILSDRSTLDKIINVANLIINCYKQNKKVMIAGNGGSAADAQHFAGELVSKFYFDRPGLSAFSLSTDTSVLTAIGNDYGYEYTFSRQIQASGHEGDIFIGISTSGNSRNIINAVNQAKELNIITVGLVGSNQCLLDDICDVVLKVPSNITPIIQESHIMIEHIICAIVEDKIFKKS